MAVAGQVEPQIDLHLRKGRQLVKDLLGQEARDGKKDAAQQDKADADGFPAREIEHGVDPFAKADPRPRAAPHGFADLLAEALAEQKADIMYRVDRNNFYQNEKKETVCTPDYVSEFLFSIIDRKRTRLNSSH